MFFFLPFSLCVKMYLLDRRRNLILSLSAPQTVMNFILPGHVEQHYIGNQAFVSLFHECKLPHAGTC